MRYWCRKETRSLGDDTTSWTSFSSLFQSYVFSTAVDAVLAAHLQETRRTCDSLLPIPPPISTSFSNTGVDSHYWFRGLVLITPRSSFAIRDSTVGCSTFLALVYRACLEGTHCVLELFIEYVRTNSKRSRFHEGLMLCTDAFSCPAMLSLPFLSQSSQTTKLPSVHNISSPHHGSMPLLFQTNVH